MLGTSLFFVQLVPVLINISFSLVLSRIFVYLQVIQNLFTIFGPSGIFSSIWFVQNLCIYLVCLKSFHLSDPSKIFPSGISYFFGPSRIFHFLWPRHPISLTHPECLIFLTRPKYLIFSCPSEMSHFYGLIQNISFSLASSRIFHFLWPRPECPISLTH